GAAHRARGPVERSNETIAGRIHLAAAQAFDLLADDAIMLTEQFLPAVIAELGGAPRRIDDVREENGGQHAVGVARGADARQELLDLIHDTVYVAAVDQMVVPLQLAQLGGRNLRRHIASLLAL